MPQINELFSLGVIMIKHNSVMKNNLKQRKYRRLSASMTVEAAFVIPVLVLCMVAIIWIGLYFYNTICAISDADGAFFLVERVVNGTGEVSKNLEMDISGNLEEYLAIRDKKGLISKKDKQVTITVSIEMNVPGRGLFGLLFNKIRNIEVKKSYKLAERAETQRMLRAAGEIIDSIRGYFKSE